MAGPLAGGDPRARSRPTARRSRVSVAKLRGEVAEITDWRKQLGEHQRPALLSAAVAGFLLGGGLAVFRRRRR